jgi:hypothetical protein
MYSFLCCASEMSVAVKIFYLLFVCPIKFMLLLFNPVFSHPRGNLASRGRVAQTANGVIRVRAPGLTSRAANVRMGVRSCGLN